MTGRATLFARAGALWLAVTTAALFGAGLAGCSHDDYYCDNTGCFYCDGAGCRDATPPTRTPCNGVWDCEANQVCTSAGCATTCTTDGDCARGWWCSAAHSGDAGTSGAQGICVSPTEPTPTPNPGSCTSNAQCQEGTVCIDGQCTRSTTPACSTNADCMNGDVCVAGRCTAPSDTCQFNNQCARGYVCVDNQCRADCSTAGCPTGQTCVTAGSTHYCAQSPTAECVHNADCGAGRVCLNSHCYTSCTPGATSCPNAGDYCTDDGVCAPDTRPSAFCDATHPCSTGSVCISGVCHVSCASTTQCQMVDVSYRACGPVPNQTDTTSVCLTLHESDPHCAHQSDCLQGQVCVDGICQ